MSFVVLKFPNQRGKEAKILPIFQASGGSSSNNIVSVALAPQHSVPTSQVVTSSNGIPHTFTFAPLPPASVVSSSTLVSLIQQPHITTQGNHDGLTFTNSGKTNFKKRKGSVINDVNGVVSKSFVKLH